MTCAKGFEQPVHRLESKVQFGQQHIAGVAAERVQPCLGCRLPQAPEVFSSRAGTPASRLRSCAPSTCSMTTSTAASRAISGERLASRARSLPRSGPTPASIACWRAR